MYFGEGEIMAKRWRWRVDVDRERGVMTNDPEWHEFLEVVGC